MRYRHTWAHMIGATCSEFFVECVGSGETKLNDGKT